MTNQRSQRRRRPRGRAAGRSFSRKLELELQSHQVSIPSAPTTFKNSPPVRRWVRQSINYSGVALTINVTPALVTSIDSMDYISSSAARYTSVRFAMCRAWLQLWDSGSSNTAPVGYPTLNMFDPATNFVLTDTGQSGTDMAKLAMVPCLQSRQTWLGVTNTTNVFVITVQANANTVGQVTFDVLVEFN